MDGQVTRESAGWSATTSIRTSYWCSLSSTLPSTMVSVGRSTLQIGYPCSTMPCGLLGIVSLLIFLNKMSVMNLPTSFRLYMKQDRSNCISLMVSFGNGSSLLSFMELSPFSEFNM